MFSLNDKRATNRGFGDGMSRAFEFAATPLLFGAAGYGLDLWLGTRPAFAIGLALFAVAGMFIRLWYGYDAEMREIESRSVWSPNRGRDRADADTSDTSGTAPTDVDLWDNRRVAGADR